MKTLKDIFKNDFASTMFRHDEAEYSQYQLVGKYCTISLEGNNRKPMLDIWIANPKNLELGLSNRRVTEIISRWIGNIQWTILDGETYGKTSDLKSVVTNRTLLGLKKKKEYSEETIATHRQNLKSINNR